MKLKCRRNVPKCCCKVPKCLICLSHKTAGDAKMHIRELFTDVISEDLDYKYKKVLNPDKPIKWLKQLLDMQTGMVE